MDRLFKLVASVGVFIMLIASPINVSAQKEPISGVGFRVEATSETAPDFILEHYEYTLRQVLSHEGLTYKSEDCFLEVEVKENKRTVIKSNPERLQIHMTVTVTAVDRATGTVLGSRSLKAIGMDETEEKSYTLAARMTNFRTGDFLGFLGECKQMLIETYGK